MHHKLAIKNESIYLYMGSNVISSEISGQLVYDRKLDGPFIIRYTGLFENGNLIDEINDAYITGNYNFNDFGKPDLPDLKADISASDEYHYGVNNVTVNITFKNIGNKNAFNVFTEIFDNGTFSKANKSNILKYDSQVFYQLNFADFSDFEIIALADSEDFVEESNESNNGEKIVIKLNKNPILDDVGNLTATEKNIILINLSASDLNEDALSFSINLSKFAINHNILEWNTTTSDSGYYLLEAAVSDGFLNDSKIFSINIIELQENDFDKDGINDTIDSLIGNKDFVNTSTLNLTIIVGNSTNLSMLFSKNLSVRFFNNELLIMEFDFNFSRSRSTTTYRPCSTYCRAACTAWCALRRGRKP